MKKNNLTYEDLKLGEKTKDLFFRGESYEEIRETCPVYVNTKPVYAGLNVTDLAIAGVLAGMNTLLVGNTGCGKSQLARDFNNYYFGGEKANGGNGLTIEGHSDLDIYSDIFTNVDLERARRVLNDNHKSLFFDLEEFNRCPPITQNQFYGIGNGRLIHNGQSVQIGRDGYRTTIATANIGNGEFQGTFETDKALLNRFGVVLDFDYPMFMPTSEDEILVIESRIADPGVKEAPIRDISDKIIQLSNEIGEKSGSPGLDALAVANYLRFGLRNCYSGNNESVSKSKTWPYQCQACNQNSGNNALCSLVREPQPRTIQSMIKYATALEYLAKLKNPKQEINPRDLMFKAFELTSAYQHVLNPSVLKQEYSDENPVMMQDVVQKLKQDYMENEDLILTSLEEAVEGNKSLDYYQAEGQTFLGYNKLNKTAKLEVAPIQPFTNKRQIGLGWVEDAVDFELKKQSSRGNSK